ncbi:MAG: energy transducer TonB [Bacteroidetes bacterium]|nr:MAG: energy transducer TonB [Bacteroidota bacterium]
MLPPTAEKAETNNSSTSGKEKKAFSKPLQIADKMPQFPGGNTAMYAYLNRRLQYPQVAKDYGVEGRVFVQFVVEPDGSLSNVKVVRGIGYGCDQEALRIVKKMPRWIPGEHQGVKAPVIYTIHVQFNLK